MDHYQQPRSLQSQMPPQKWAMPSMRHDTCFGLTPKLFFSPGTFRGLDAHVQQWAQKKRWESWRNLQESGAKYPLSWQHSCQCPPRDCHTPSEPAFCTTSFSSTCMFPQDSSWDVRQVPWCFSDEHTHLLCKPLLPDLNKYHQRMEKPLVHSQEKLVPLEPVVSMRSHPTSMTLATVLPNPPLSQRPQFCSREFLPFFSNQQVGIPTWKSWDCPEEAWAPGRENQVLSTEDIRETQAPEWANQRDSSKEDAWEIETSQRQLPINFGLEDNAETKVLEWESQRLVITKTDGEILTAGWENQDHLGVENKAKIQELGKRRSQKEARGENPPETQAHIVENQEQLRCKIDAETQTPEWGSQDRSRSEDAIETQVFEKNKKATRGESEGETQSQGFGKHSQARSENGEACQEPWWRKQDEIRGDAGTEIQAEERRNQTQVGGENVVQTQVSGKGNLGEVKQEDGIDIQALGWGKQECVDIETATETQTPGWGKQDQGRSEKAREEFQKQLRHEFRVGWGSQGLRKGKGAGETHISRRKNLREIREEDWVVIQTPWWEDQRPLASKIDREFEIFCWGNQDQIGSEHRAEIQAPKKRYQRKDTDEDSINTLAPEVENQGQETHVDTHPPNRRNEEQFGDETSTDIQVPEMENLREVKGEDGKETQELGEENQGQLNNEINGKSPTPKWKNQVHRSKDGANTQASDTENWEELTSKIDGETHSAEWKKEEQAGGENGMAIQAPEKRNQREAGGEDGTETWTPGEENWSQLRGDTVRKTHLLEWKNQEQMGGENGTEIQAPEKRNQREPGIEDGVEIQRPERENLGQLDSEIGENYSPGWRNWEQSGGKNDEENQTLEKRNQKEVGSDDGEKIQRLRGENQRLLKSKINGKTCTSEWKNQEQIGEENGAKIQEKRNLRGSTDVEDRETQASGGDYQEQLRSQLDGEIKIKGQESQKEGGDEDAAEIWDVGSQRKCRAEDAGETGVPRGGIKDQVREWDAAKGNLRVDCSGDEGPPVLTGSGYGAMEQEQAVASATCPKMKPLPHGGELFLLSSGEGKHLASQNTAPARKHRVGISLASPQAPPKTPRSQQRDKRVDPEKASGLVWQLQNPQSLAASPSLPSSCSSDSCGQAPQAATALVSVPSALTVLPKWPVLKKSQQLLLESLMRRKIAHLKWGIPQRILDSHLFFNMLDPCQLPFAEMWLQWQQEKVCETQGSRPGLKSPGKSQRVQLPERKSSKLSTQARALETRGPQGSEPKSIFIHPPKPRRVRPPRGPRERQGVQEEVPPRAKLPAPRNARPAVESRNLCAQERVRELSSENSRDRKMIRPGVCQMAERAPSRMRTSYSRAGHDHWRKDSTSQEASKPPRLKCQQSTHWSRGSLEGRGIKQQSSSCSKDTPSFKGSLHSAPGSLSMTLLNKKYWSLHLANLQHSAPNLSLRGSDLTLLPPKVGDPHGRQDSTGVHASPKTDLHPPGHRCAGVILPKMGSLQGQGEPENPNGASRNPPALKKFGFMKHMRGFLLRHCFRK
uniref:Uncharacterized protein n=1 Tax=Molossus molossus TaxID=27622 RepID=A0A7J8FW46_MOLMO|nr:hypothetical protein HJG59_001833 [Molossus molossus]